MKESRTQSVWSIAVQMTEFCFVLVIILNSVRLRVPAKTYIVRRVLYPIDHAPIHEVFGCGKVTIAL